MNIRTFIFIALAVFTLGASFGAPHLANADSSCTATDTNGKTVTGVLVNGTCSVSCTTQDNNGKTVTLSLVNSPNGLVCPMKNGSYCSINAGCQSGYCSLDHTFFTFLNACATPPVQTGGASGSWGTTPTGGTTGSSLGGTGGTSGGSLGRTDNTNPSPNVTLMNPLKGVDCSAGNGSCLSAFLINILKFVINIGSLIVILMLVYVGFLFVVAQGNESKITEARNALLWTVVGALVLLGAQAIAMGIQATVTALGG